MKILELNGQKLEFTQVLFKARINTMYLVVDEECISCIACESECPTGAIEMKDGDIAFINQDKCEECGDCVSICPTGAIVKK